MPQGRVEGVGVTTLETGHQDSKMEFHGRKTLGRGTATNALKPTVFFSIGICSAITKYMEYIKRTTKTDSVLIDT